MLACLDFGGAMRAAAAFGRQQHHGLPLAPRCNASASTVVATAGEDKVLHLVRHGETDMNVHLGRLPPGRQYGEPGFRDPHIPDTRLTRQGHAQAAAARAAAGALAPPPQALLVSPLTRALQTADIMFEGLSCPRVATPLAAERLYLSSDVGRPREALEGDFPHVCFGELPRSCGDGGGSGEGVWWHDDGAAEAEEGGWEEPRGEHDLDLVEAREPAAAFLRRVERLRLYLAGRPEESLAVVSHWGVLHALTGRSFHNCEVASLRLSQLRARPHLLQRREGAPR